MRGRLTSHLSTAWQAARLPLAIIGTWIAFALLVALGATSQSSGLSSLYLLAAFAALLSPLAYAIVVNSPDNGRTARSGRGHWLSLFLCIFLICFLFTLSGDSTSRTIAAILIVMVAGLALANRRTK
jgi:drug/metabolite transporter (DMT)-like permease